MVYQNLEKNCTPFVSIVIITYNQEQLIAKTIESVLAQKSQYTIELIIADDCSPDGTLKKCLEYYEQYPHIIRVVENSQNKGLIKNFHETIRDYARGKYIAVVAGDDWWHDEYKIQKQVQFLEENTDYGLVFSDTLVYSHDSGQYRKYKPVVGGYTFDQLIIHNCIPALTACYRKELFEEYIKDVDPVTVNFPGEDYPMWLWFSHQSKIHRIPEPLATYRLQMETLSHSNSKQRRVQFEIDRFDIKMFFYKYFNINDENILHDIYLVYYFLTLNAASEAGRTDIETDRFVFFRDHKYYILQIMAILNHKFSHILIVSQGLRFLLKVCMRFRLLNRYYKVYNRK